MSNFYEEAKAAFTGIPEEEITNDLCGIYLSNQRLKDSFGGVHVPYGITANLLRRFVTGKINQKTVVYILYQAQRFGEILNLYNIHKEEAAKYEADSPERGKHLLAAEAYWTSLGIMYAPITCYEGGLKVIDIDRIIAPTLSD